MAQAARHHGSQSRAKFTMCPTLARNIQEETSFFTHAGQDATDVFSAFHPVAIYNWLPWFYVGDLVKDSNSTSADAEKEVDYRRDITAMKSELMKAHAFESSKLYYLFKVASDVAILGVAIAAVVLLNGMPGAMIGGALLALFWQQCGWLVHDFLHHQVFKNRIYNNLSGLIIGNVWQGSLPLGGR